MPLPIVSLFPFRNGEGGIHLLAIIYMYFQCREEGNALLVVVHNILHPQKQASMLVFDGGLLFYIY